jgi:hypothetical protein
MCHDSFRTYHFPTKWHPRPINRSAVALPSAQRPRGCHRRCGKSFKARDFWAGFGSRGWIPKYLIPLGISQADPTAWDGSTLRASHAGHYGHFSLLRVTGRGTAMTARAASAGFDDRKEQPADASARTGRCSTVEECLRFHTNAVSTPPTPLPGRGLGSEPIDPPLRGLTCSATDVRLRRFAPCLSLRASRQRQLPWHYRPHR